MRLILLYGPFRRLCVAMKALSFCFNYNVHVRSLGFCLIRDSGGPLYQANLFFCFLA